MLITQACSPSSQAPDITNADAKREARLQREIAIKTEMKYTQILQDVAYPILTANVQLCGPDIAPYVGMITQSKAVISEENYEVAKDFYGVGEHPTVVILAEGSPASKVLRIGDVITHVNGEALKSGKAGHLALNQAIRKHTSPEPITFTIQRGDRIGTVQVPLETACSYPVLFDNASTVNASADGKRLYVTAGMMRFVETDAELALVIGHEMAHNSRSHIDAKRGNAVMGSVLGTVITVATGVDVIGLGSHLAGSAYSQSFENEADYVGIYHTARAGFPIEDAPYLWRRMGAANAGAIHLKGTSHPSTAKRFLALEAAVKEIKAKQAAGLPLIPEEKVIKASQDHQGLNK